MIQDPTTQQQMYQITLASYSLFSAEQKASIV